MKILWWINPNNISEDSREKYENVLTLLEQLKVNRQIDFQVIKDYSEKKIYYEIFYKNKNRLFKNTAKSIRDELRSGKNKKNYSITGTIVFFDGNTPIYYINFYDKESENFLKNILDEGTEYLYKLIESNRKLMSKKPEDKLEIEFENRAKELGFCGKLIHKYKLSVPELERKGWGRASEKEIDFIHEDVDQLFDIVEVKARKLNWEALGQVIGYKKLFCKERNISEGKVNCVIVCKEYDEFIGFVCKNMNIRVIIL